MLMFLDRIFFTDLWSCRQKIPMLLHSLPPKIPGIDKLGTASQRIIELCPTCTTALGENRRPKSRLCRRHHAPLETSLSCTCIYVASRQQQIKSNLTQYAFCSKGLRQPIVVVVVCYCYLKTRRKMALYCIPSVTINYRPGGGKL